LRASGIHAERFLRAPLVVRAVFKVLRKLRHGSLSVTTPDGETQVFGGIGYTMDAGQLVLLGADGQRLATFVPLPVLIAALSSADQAPQPGDNHDTP